MYKWLQKNNKSVLAFIMVFLMIAFLLPSTFRGCDPTHMAIGSIGKQRISELDAASAYREWEFVRQNILVPTNAGGQQTWRPLVSATVLQLADRPIEENKLMYYLLREEARQMGATVQPAALDELLAQVGFRFPDNRIVDYDTIKGTVEGRNVRVALANVLSIQSAFERAVSNIKISQPQRKAEAAMQLQTITLGLVPFEVSAYLEKVATPTKEQLAEHFNKFAETVANRPNKENPFGFGYKFPDRVKLQYISVGRDEIRKAVLAQKSDYDWEVEARRHYMANLSSFPTTQRAATQPGATTQTVTQPFEDVKAQAMEAVLAPKVDAMARMVQQRILLALNNDYAAWAKANPTTGPAAGGAASTATSLGAPYDTFEYLQALAADVQKQFGVVARVVNLGDRPRNHDELAELDGIALSEAMVQGRSLAFAEYVFTTAQPLMPANSKDHDQAFALHLFQPSQTLTAFDGTFAVYRLTSAEATHKSASIDEVMAQVEADLRTKLAFEAASADAKKLIDSARGSSLDTAASAAGKLVIDSGPLRWGQPVEIPGLPVTTENQRSFLVQAFDLLAVSEAEKQPLGLIEQPRAGRVLAAQLRDVWSIVPQDRLAAVEAEIATGSTVQMLRELAPQWFSYESVVQRTGYKDLYAKPEAKTE